MSTSRPCSGSHTLYNIPCACNRATADFVISSKLMGEPYERITIDGEALVVQEEAFVE